MTTRLYEKYEEQLINHVCITSGNPRLSLEVIKEATRVAQTLSRNNPFRNLSAGDKSMLDLGGLLLVKRYCSTDAAKRMPFLHEELSMTDVGHLLAQQMVAGKLTLS